MEKRKENLLTALRAFVRQRPGLEFANYGDLKAYRAELRSITKDLSHAQELLAAVAWRDSITADAIIKASKGAYSGRLTISEPQSGHFELDYCTGQYWPTEYRRAVCAVLSSALWGYWRDAAPAGAGHVEPHSNLTNVGDWIRKQARGEFGRSIAARWFA